MSDRAVQDDALEAMLEARAGIGAPAGLRREILDAVMTDSVAREQRAGARKGRRDDTTLRLLAVAAVIGTIAGALIVAGGDRRTPDPLRDARVPPLATPSVSPPTRPTTAPTPGPTVEPETAPPDAPPPPCDRIAQITGAIRPNPSFETLHGRPANGDLLLAPMHADQVAASLDRLTIAGDRSTIIESLPTFNEPPLRPSPDGALVAIDLSGRGAGAGCGESVLLVSLADGTIAQPFELGEWDVVKLATWSVDGSTLYAVHESLDSVDGAPPLDMGSVLSWDRRTGTVTTLGSPCPGCRVVALFPSRAGGGLVVDVCDTGCSSNHSIRTRQAAVLGKDGRWGVVVDELQSAFGLSSGVPESLGLTDGSRMVAGTDRAVGTLSLDGSAATEQFLAMSCGGILRSTLSPDGSAVASILDDGVVRLGILDLASGRWTYKLAGLRPGACPSPDPDVTQFFWPAPVWSPDMTQVAIVAPATTNVRIVPVDGSAGSDALVHTGSSALAWLPKVP